MKESRKNPRRKKSEEPRHCNFKLSADKADEGLQRVTEAVRQIVTISKAELEKREAAYKAAHRKRPNPIKHHA